MAVSTTQNIWLMHAGDKGQGYKLFMDGYAAIGWREIGDPLSEGKDFTALKRKIAEHFPNKRESWRTWANEIWSFIVEVNRGDIVVYRPKKSDDVFIGEVIGDYEYQPELSEETKEFPNIRRVRWEKPVSADSFKQIIRQPYPAIQRYATRSDEFYQELMGMGLVRTRYDIGL